MRVKPALAWTMVVLALLTAGLLRQFHDQIPTSPVVSPIVGSLLFAGVFVLLLVTAREWRRGAVPGRGVRLGSITPLLLMLLGEKWISLTLYPLIFFFVASAGAGPRLLDAQYRTLAGVGLLLTCILLSRFSRPTMRKTWRRARPSRWPLAAVGMLVVLAGCYLCIGGLSWLLGGELRLAWPQRGPLLLWVLGGQALLAFAEEVYFRGLLLSEVERLAPRLGIRNPAARRWIALWFTALLFGMEHLVLGPPWDASFRQLVFTISLGLLLGILVMITANLHFAGGVHAWINWLLLGAAPYFVDADGRAALLPGTYIGVTLVLAFALALGPRRWRRAHVYRDPDELPV